MSTPAAATANGDGSLVPEWKVQVYLYDLSQGMARALSQQFLGKQIDGIWHTGIVVYGYEYFYGGGIQATRPGHSMAGQPMRVIDIGYTRLPPPTFHQFLRGVSHRFTSETYSLLEWNCNNFSNEASLFLTGQPIPSYITGLPQEALNTPFGMMLRPMIQQMENQMRQGGGAQGMGGMGGAIPWSSQALDLPRGIDGLKGDRTVPANSNPSAPHSLVDAAAALAAQAINQAAHENIATAAAHQGTAAGATTTAAAAPSTATAAASSSSSATVSVLNRAASTPASFLTSTDKKAKSFHILLKANAKKRATSGEPDAAPLTAQQEETLLALVNALSEDKAVVKPEGCALMASFVKWPASLQFPVLGVLRVLVLRDECGSYYDAVGSDLAQALIRFLPQEPKPTDASEVAPPNAQSMALCTLANLISLPSLSVKIAASPALWAALRGCLAASSTTATVRLMATNLAYNACIVLDREKGEGDVYVDSLMFLIESVKTESAPDATGRLLLALSELMHDNAMFRLLANEVEFTQALDGIGKKFPQDAQVQLSVKELKAIMEKLQYDDL